MMDATKQGWIYKTHEAILSVERYLGIKGDSEQVKNFSTLANWIYETDANPLAFMPEGWETDKESAQSFATFLQILHHAMLGDGNLIFVENSGGSSFMILNLKLNDTDKIQELYEKRIHVTYPKPYVVHEDVTRFIKQANWYGNTGIVMHTLP